MLNKNKNIFPSRRLNIQTYSKFLFQKIYILHITWVLLNELEHFKKLNFFITIILRGLISNFSI